MSRKHLTQVKITKSEPYLELSRESLDRVESAYKTTLDPTVRQKITETTTFFVRNSRTEKVLYQKHLEEKLAKLYALTVSLQKDIGSKGGKALLRRSLLRPNEIVRRYFYHAPLGSSRSKTSNDEYRVKLLSHTLECVSVVCECLKDLSGFTPEVEWDAWVWSLTRIVKDHGLPHGVSKASNGKISPFVMFIRALQAELPPEVRRTANSDEALSGAIVRARNSVKDETGSH